MFCRIKKKLPKATKQEIKKKMMKALALQLELLNNNDFMYTFSKTLSVNLEKTEVIDDDEKENEENLNEDMEDYLS